MIKKIRRYRDLPLEVGKEYLTKMQSKETFIIERIDYEMDSGEKIEVLAWGIYTRTPHIGVCPLSPDRIVHDKIEAGEVDACPHCGGIL